MGVDLCLLGHIYFNLLLQLSVLMFFVRFYFLLTYYYFFVPFLLTFSPSIYVFKHDPFRNLIIVEISPCTHGNPGVNFIKDRDTDYQILSFEINENRKHKVNETDFM